MSDVQKDTNLIANEYRSVTVHKNMEALWRDSFANFGWKFGKSEPAIVNHVWGPLRVMLAPLAIIPGSPFARMVVDHKSDSRVELKFRRERNIAKKSELNQLQSRFEACAAEIDNLEGSKKNTATAAAYIVGLAGTVFMGASVFSYLAGMLPLSIMMAVPGFALWILSYFIYQAVKNGRKRKISPLIEKQYDMIYEICRSASGILHAEKSVL